MAALSDKQRRFVEEYLATWNGTEAARRAGYKGNDNTLAVVASENMHKGYIRAEIDARLDELSRSTDVRVKQVAESILANGRHISAGMSQRHGWVYLIREEHGAVKIGKTISRQRRLSTLETMVPYALECLLTIETEDIHILEANIHAEYTAKRIKGEWFRLSGADIEAIRRTYGT